MRYHRQSRIFQCTGLFAVFINMNMALADDRSEPSTRPVEPSSQWQSAFADYDAFEAQPVLSWPMLNRRVGDIGGWRTYAMEPYVEKPAEASSDEGSASSGRAHEDGDGSHAGPPARGHRR